MKEPSLKGVKPQKVNEIVEINYGYASKDDPQYDKNGNRIPDLRGYKPVKVRKVGWGLFG